MLESCADAEGVESRADLAQGAGLRLGVVATQAVDAALRVLDETVGHEDGAARSSAGVVATLPSGCQVRTTRSGWEGWMPPRALWRTWASALS